MTDKKAIDTLNILIQINNDRMEGYETAAHETEEEDLKELFAQLAQTSRECNEELVEEVEELDGTPAEGTKTSGKVFRVWMDVKAALAGKDRKTILNSCEQGEEMAVNTYKKVLEINVDDLSNDQQSIIEEQLVLIKADRDTVKELHESFLVPSGLPA